MPDETPTGAARTAETLARAFHEAYERLAPSFGYETRAETRAFDPTTPNGRLMVAVCGEMLAHLAGQAGPEVRGLVDALMSPTAEGTIEMRTALLAAYAAKDAELAQAVAALRADEDGPDDDLVGLSLIWIGGEEMHDRFLAWYKPEDWPLGRHRAASAFLRMELAALRQQRDEAERERGIEQAAIGRLSRVMHDPAVEWKTNTGTIGQAVIDFAVGRIQQLEAEAAAERQRAERLARVLRDARENEQLQNADPVLCCEIDNVLEEPTR